MMAQTEQHTPGPWLYKAASSTSRNILDIKGDGKLLAFTVKTCDESAANARLIAAAPELLEALRRCVQSLEGDWERTEVVEFARAAIAKATGVSS